MNENKNYMLKTLSDITSDVCSKYVGNSLRNDTINNIITDLNNNIFPDNFAEFENISTLEDLSILFIRFCIKYKGKQYDISEFEKIYLRHIRDIKLKKINNVRYTYF
jgi:hypothetical protein